MIVIGVSKCRQKSFREVNGKRYYSRYECWKMFYYDKGKFGTRYLKGLDIAFAKARVHKLKTYKCENCGLKYRSNKKGCPDCE